MAMPLLSGWAYEADVAIGITGTLLRESATQIRRGGALMVGQVRQAPQNWAPPKFAGTAHVFVGIPGGLEREARRFTKRCRSSRLLKA